MRANKAKVYYEVAKFNFYRILAYPWEIVAFFVSRIIILGFLAIFWYAISKSNRGSFDFRQLTAYFLVAQSVRDLTFSTSTRLGNVIRKTIKYGEINNVLIKPVSEIKFLLAEFIGENGAQIFFAILGLIAGLVILPPKNVSNLIGFALFLILTFLISIGINIYIGLLAFHSPEAGGIQNVFNNFNRVLCGTLIPLVYFPEFWRKMLMFTPFPALAFTPTYILQNQLGFSQIFQIFAVGIFWAVFLIFSSNYFWKKSLKKYEGIGI
ncbi:MAG: ABC-2 family transporter protein [bacterium]